MEKFRLTGLVTISVYTEIKAETLEEAIELSEEREGIKKSEWGQDHEVSDCWLSDEYDGAVFDIKEE